MLCYEQGPKQVKNARDLPKNVVQNEPKKSPKVGQSAQQDHPDFGLPNPDVPTMTASKKLDVKKFD